MKLEIGQSIKVDVDPSQRYFPSNLDVCTHESYRFSATGSWRDASHHCGPTGWQSVWTRPILRFSRLPNYDLFYLGGAINCNENNKFPIGTDTEITMKASGQLFLFANDLWLFYGNNYRVDNDPMLVEIHRTA